MDDRSLSLLFRGKLQVSVGFVAPDFQRDVTARAIRSMAWSSIFGDYSFSPVCAPVISNA
jgi:hypothetical protein